MYWPLTLYHYTSVMSRVWSSNIMVILGGGGGGGREKDDGINYVEYYLNFLSPAAPLLYYYTIKCVDTHLRVAHIQWQLAKTCRWK